MNGFGVGGDWISIPTLRGEWHWLFRGLSGFSQSLGSDSCCACRNCSNLNSPISRVACRLGDSSLPKLLSCHFC